MPFRTVKTKNVCISNPFLGVFALVCGGVALAIGHLCSERKKAIENADRKNDLIDKLEKLNASLGISQRRLSSVLDTVLDAIVIIDQAGLITDWNATAERIFGYSKTEVLGRNIQMLMPEPFRSEHGRYLDHYKITGKGRIIGREREVKGLRKDGTTFPMDLAVSEFWSEGEKYFTGVIRDITERRKNEAALAASEARFRVALKNAPITVCTVDRSLRYTWIYGLPEGFKNREFLGKTADEVFGPETARPLTEFKRQALSAGETRKATIKMTLEKAEQTFNVVAEPMRNEHGEVDGLLTAIMDVSEIATAKARAETANEAKSNFLANISHEIRTPIGVIQGFAELLIEQESRPDARQMLLTILKNTRQLIGIVGEVLDVTKIEANRLDLEIFRFPLSELIDDVKSTLKFKADEKGVRFLANCQGGLPAQMVSDPTRLKQILINVGSNAVKFTKNGSVEMIFRCGEEISGACFSLEVVVRDTGIGMSKEQQERIFTPFVQADSSMTRKYGGTGLGLFISRRLARALGGDLVLVKSEIGQGSEFFLRVKSNEQVLPAEMPKRTFVEEKKIDEGAVSKRILLAEDSVDNQVLISRILKKYGVNVEVANNGREALLKAAKERFDVVLMDIQMPEVDGFEATRQLRCSGFGGAIIALTAHALKEERERALRAGFDEYVTKPIDRNELLEAIRSTRHELLH
jgi:PAS domain S-box-containing protein